MSDPSSNPQTETPTQPSPTDDPISLSFTLDQPAAMAGREPEQPIHALLRVDPARGLGTRPRINLSFVVDSSASMHRFVLEPEQRAHWRQIADQRGDVRREMADGQEALVWTGQTLREMQQQISTPMLSALKGIWRNLQALGPEDSIATIGFADRASVIYEDHGIADAAARQEAAKNALAKLGSGVDESGLGRGTRLADALRLAVDRVPAEQRADVLSRVVLISDGIIEDIEECEPLIEAALDRGIVITAIGVGDDFDEEILMRVADVTRGSYTYAATAPEVEQAIVGELGSLMNAIGRTATLYLRAEPPTILRDLHSISPTLGEFPVIWTDEAGWRIPLGDLSGSHPLELLVELAPPALPAGESCLARASLSVRRIGAPGMIEAELEISQVVTEEAVVARTQEDAVLDVVRRVEVYRAERRAAAAAARGDAEGATRNLQAATRALRDLGQNELADDMAAEAQGLSTGTRNLSRTKRLKAGTRRLGTRRLG